MKKILVIEMGMGVDLHGQDITRAAVRAVENAIRHNSLPGLRDLVDGDMSRMRVHVKLALPADADKLDQDAVKAVFPYGQVSLELLPGGMLTTSGIVLADKGDRNDLIYVVIASVEVGL